MVKNGDLNLNFFPHKYFISSLHKYFISLEYISMIVYTNVENHLFSSLIICDSVTIASRYIKILQHSTLVQVLVQYSIIQ